MSSCAISVTPTFLCKQITNFPIGHSQYNKDVCHILFQIFIQNEITSRRHFPKTSKGKKNRNQQKRPLFVALATETDKDVDKNSCRNNQATEHGNKYDKNTRGSLFHLHRFGRIVTYCIKWNIIVVFAFGLCFYQEVLVLQIVQSYQTADVLFEMGSLPSWALDARFWENS